MKITPDEFFTNESSIATISAEVLSVNLSLLSVTAYKTDEYGNVLSQLGQMYDDGTHGDLKKTNSIFTTTINVNEPEDILIYVRVVATYEQDPNQYLSSIMEINFFKHISHEAWLKGKEILKEIKRLYLERLSIMSSNEARKLAYQDTINNPNIKSAVLHGVYLSILFKGGSRGFRASVRLDDSTIPIDASGEGIPSVLPKSYKSLSSNKLLIFAPGYYSSQEKIANYAKDRFTQSEYALFDPNPSVISKGSDASLETIKHWGNYSVIVLHAHGGVWKGKEGDENSYVTIESGTPSAYYETYEKDISMGRIGVGETEMFSIYPSFILKYVTFIEDTFLYLGSCNSMQDNTMWEALKEKGAKGAFGWSDTVSRSFNEVKFKEVINAMLPIDSSTDLLTAQETYDSISDKVDGWCLFEDVCIGGSSLFNGGATLTLKTSTLEWNDFILYETGVINGDFELMQENTSQPKKWKKYDFATKACESKQDVLGLYPVEVENNQRMLVCDNTSVYSSGSMNTFFIPKNSTELSVSFDWRVISEELNETGLPGKLIEYCSWKYLYPRYRYICENKFMPRNDYLIMQLIHVETNERTMIFRGSLADLDNNTLKPIGSNNWLGNDWQHISKTIPITAGAGKYTLRIQLYHSGYDSFDPSASTSEEGRTLFMLDKFRLKEI